MTKISTTLLETGLKPFQKMFCKTLIYLAVIYGLVC